MVTKSKYLLLKGEEVGDAAINGIAEAGLRFVADGHNGIDSLVGRDMQKQLGHVAGSKNLVHGSKVCSPLLRVEVWRKYASIHTLPSQELAGPAGTAAAAATAARNAAARTHLRQKNEGKRERSSKRLEFVY